MREELLHYIWRIQKVDQNGLTTTGGDQLTILAPGKYNTNAGPDFLEAKIKLNNTIWAGHIEMHVKASDWYKHRHQVDQAYHNVILHVVFEADKPVLDQNKKPIPTLEISNKISSELIDKHQRLMENQHWIPCQAQLQVVPDHVKKLWNDRLIIDRLQDKTTLIEEDLRKSQWDWEHNFFVHLAMHLGSKVNKDAFRLLTQSIHLNLLLKHRHSLHELEALLFGQAGLLLDHFEDSYPQKLKSTYLFLQKKYDLVPINHSVWNFLRLRPANFPTIRIAQLSTLLFMTEHLFSKCLAAQNRKEIENTFQIELNNYWTDHYVFDKISARKSKKKLGKSTILNLIINTVAPFLFVYSKAKGKHEYLDKALRHLESIPAESNHIIKKWINYGYPVSTAMDSQALLQLKNKYCDHQRCLECRIGHYLLK